MAKHDVRNPTGSDVIAQKIREERKPKHEGPAKRRQSLISFEVASEPGGRHAPPRASKSVRTPNEEYVEKAEKHVKKIAAATPRWKRIAVIVVILLLLAVLFANNYRKNVYIEELKSANEEFAKAYNEQQSRITELEQRLGEARTGS